MRATLRVLGLVLAGVGLGAGVSGAAEDPVKIYKARCASCHGASGKADNPMGKRQAVRDMTAPAWQKEFTDDVIKRAIEEGIKRDKGGVKQNMPGYRGKLSSQEIDAQVAYIRTLK